MVSAAEPSGQVDARPRPTRRQGVQDQSWLLPVLAVERALQAVVLVGIGLILPSHAHADWVELAWRYAQQIGLDPSRNETGRPISRLGGFGSRQAQHDKEVCGLFGRVASQVRTSRTERARAARAAARRCWAEARGRPAQRSDHR